jgi:hypothetical protein
MREAFGGTRFSTPEKKLKKLAILIVDAVTIFKLTPALAAF